MSTPLNQLPSANSMMGNMNNSGALVQQNQFPPQMQQQMPQQMSQQMPQQMPQQMQQQMPQQMQQNNLPIAPDSELMDDILKEMEDTTGYPQSNINSESLNYTMDPSQIPPEQLPMDNLPNVNGGRDYTRPLDMSNYVAQNVTFSQKIMNYVRQPAIVFAICVILAVPQFNRLLARLVPRLLKESGHFNMYGILLKGLLGAAVFFIANHYV